MLGRESPSGRRWDSTVRSIESILGTNCLCFESMDFNIDEEYPALIDNVLGLEPDFPPVHTIKPINRGSA